MKIAVVVPVFLLLLGAVSGPSWAAETVVLFDQGHGQRFLIQEKGALDLSVLADIFREQQAEVRSSAGRLTAETLAPVDVLVVAGPFVPLSREESAAIMKFLEDGGSLVVLVHIAEPLKPLFGPLGVGIAVLPVYEQKDIIGNQPRDFRVTELAPHPLTENLESFSMYGAWPLLNTVANIEVVASTSETAWIDLDRDGVPGGKDPIQAFPLVLSGKTGRGRFVVFGDDAIFQNRFMDDHNTRLAKNLSAWLCARGNEI